jgi:ubiquinone/menaquinone biosynthesis C-methylase UbiE
MCSNVNLITDAIESESLSAEEEAFAGRLIAMVNHGMAGLMIAIGHRTGLFGAMRGAGMLSSEDLATRADLDERYVREWLGAMATAGIVLIDRASGKFMLPAAHAAFLGSDATHGSMSSYFQYLSVLGAVETQIVDCFRNGGGLSYRDYDRFHECMAEDSYQNVVAALEDAILPLAPWTIGQLERGIDVADVGCGLGKAMIRLASLFPNSRFTGYDLCADTVLLAEIEAAERGLDNVRFERADATLLKGDGLFDLIFTFDAIHDQAHPAAVLAHIRRLLKPGGTYVMQEIRASSDVADNLDNPLAPFIYTVSCMHCMSVSLGQGGVGLGAAWGTELALAMLVDAGFPHIAVHQLPHDLMNNYFVCRPD